MCFRNGEFLITGHGTRVGTSALDCTMCSWFGSRTSCYQRDDLLIKGAVRSSPTIRCASLCFSGAMTRRAAASMEVHVVTIVDLECPAHLGDNDATTIDHDCSCSRSPGPAIRVRDPRLILNSSE